MADDHLDGDEATGRTRTAFITGISGQDGSYLAELLLARGYEVHGVIRRSSSFNTDRLDGIYQDPHESHRRLFLHYGDITDASRLTNLIRELRPDEIYNFAAQSHVKVSFEMPEYTGDATALGTIRLLDAIRGSGIDTRYFQASTSEMFGSTPPPQNETSAFAPRSPYGIAKLYSYWATVNYREAYGLHASNGIMFNHESERRGETFVTRKTSRAIARILAGLQTTLYVGNLDAVRDWGYAPEYVEGAWRMVQHESPDDYVLATGVPATVREFCEYAFEYVGLDWARYVRFDPRYERPAEVPALIGDASKARGVLGWKPKLDWREVARRMVDADVARLDDDLAGRSIRIDR
jgi:GDPmannose 4,6-dehydratase